MKKVKNTSESIESKWNNDDVPEGENGILYMCPQCGHTFKQGEWNYDYDTALLDFECQDCGWCGRETQCNTYED